MIKYFKSENGRIGEIDALCAGCWVSVISPTAEEVTYLTQTLRVDPDFVRSSLDEEETSHIETEEDQTLIIIDTPVAEKQSQNTMLYYTTPIGVVILPEFIITISLKENTIISEFEGGMVKNAHTHMKTRFFLMLLLRMAGKYLQYLKQIDKISDHLEKQLHKSMKNQELIQLLGLEKSLVYFSTSLKSNEVTLEKILRGRYIKLYEEDQDILEDVLIEVKQAIEMSNIYSSILSGTMDAFASIISNNLNIVMKVLTSLTIVMAIPTMIFSFYGMNTMDLPLPFTWFPIVLTVVATLAAVLILFKKGMFK
ncbi:MAG: magnesium transporter CorA family protein [Oscillospiraceae bacterium]|nr:magnesium transporter CorA family protein [Oscillospiraceae bacterium]MBQ8732279.1 magnesium transporter CorA family protein [Oscillospiraceae bacterium]